MPILTHESDGYAVAPSFLRQVEVPIQQVLDRAAQSRVKAQAGSPGLAGIFRSARDKWSSLRENESPAVAPTGV
ncbi:MAG: hypothetical protein ABSH48_22260 [Verrucomicrobiota bacterium]|jgi:hypothetical protein